MDFFHIPSIGYTARSLQVDNPQNVCYSEFAMYTFMWIVTGTLLGLIINKLFDIKPVRHQNYTVGISIVAALITGFLIRAIEPALK